MALYPMLQSVSKDTVGAEVIPRMIGAKEPPAKMVIQIAVTGAARVQIQGRITRDAPWQDIGGNHSASTLMHIDPVQFVRAVATEIAPGANASAWAAWGW
ncbi:MAG: hypothetical protein ACJ8MH_18995 [Povalibacter sp.]